MRGKRRRSPRLPPEAAVALPTACMKVVGPTGRTALASGHT